MDQPVMDQPGVDGPNRSGRGWAKGNIMLLAIVLIVLAILLGLGGLIFTAVKWLLIIAVVFLIAGAVAGFLARGKSKSVR